MIITRYCEIFLQQQRIQIRKLKDNVTNIKINGCLIMQIAQKLAVKLIHELERHTHNSAKAVFKEFLTVHPDYDFKRLDHDQFLDIAIKVDGKVKDAITLRRSLSPNFCLKKIIAELPQGCTSRTRSSFSTSKT